MESLYSVVHFVNEDTVDVVPSNWIKDIDTCAWPFNQKHAKKMIEQKYQPNNKEFAFLKIRMICSGIKTLAEARFIAKKAELTSDLPDDDFSRKQIKINKFSSTKFMECPIYHSDAEKFPLFKRNSIDDNNRMQPSLFSPFMINSDAEKSTLLKRNSFDESNHKKISLFSPLMNNSDKDKHEGISYHNTFAFRTDNSKLENIGDISHRNSPDLSNNFKMGEILTGRKSYFFGEDHDAINDLSNNFKMGEILTGRKSYLFGEDHDAINDKEFKKQIIGHVMYFKEELKHLTNTLENNHTELLERVQSIEKCLEDKPTKLYEQTNVDINCMSDCSLLPIDNVPDLNTLEFKTLGDEKALINELSRVGGKNVKTAVKRIMSKLFTNSFLAEYSFTGKRGKKKFCDLFIFPIILKSIKKQVKFKSASDHEIEELLKIYLAQAPFANKR